VSPFSLQVRQEILCSFPEWEPFAVEERWKESEPYLLVTIQAPATAGALPLRISTWDDEVTVDFDHYHAHFDYWLPKPSEPEELAALPFVQALLREEVTVASWWLESAFKASSQRAPGEDLKAPLGIKHSRVRVRSWRGTHNVDRSA
jgi:hypothetical protein